MAKDQLKDLHLFAMESALPFGMGIINNAKTGGLKKIIDTLNSEDPFSHYYAIGIRNSFGLAFDPLTGNLWDTENGQICCDEINLVHENFNSGWALAQGMATEDVINLIPEIENFQYSNPEFTWDQVNAPTAIAIPGNDWGEKYQNSLLQQIKLREN